MTTAMILAAGLGKRLRTVHDGPKWMTPVADTTPMIEQLASIAVSGYFDRILVVVDRDDGPIAQRLDTTPPGITTELIVNERSDHWNNWSSALLGLTAADGDAVMLFNSDLFADRTWFGQSLSRTIESDHPALLIDLERPLTDEAMKVSGGETVSGIGKVGVASPIGEYVGLAWWPRTQATGLIRILEGYVDDPSCADRWYEHAISTDIEAGMTYRVIATPSSEWVEIDDPDDLDVAVRLRGR